MRAEEAVALDHQRGEARMEPLTQEDRRFKVCDGCGLERHVGQWRIRRLLTTEPALPRQVGLCDECSRPLRAADATFPAPPRRRRKKLA
jgi:hypothetical protein